MADTQHRLVLSVDVDEWFHSRRWVEGPPATIVPDTTALFRRLYRSDRPAGEVIEPTRRILQLFARYRIRTTFFVLGEVAEWYPDLVSEIAGCGHEIASHGMHHVDMTRLGPARFEEQLQRATERLTAITGVRPAGFRAPDLVYEPWATRILENAGFVYDSSVCASRSIGGKYQGWTHAPMSPYHPSYESVAVRGDARIVELPLPGFPLVRIAAGSGILTRVAGFHWTAMALRAARRHGNTGFYFHPWEIGPRPRPEGHALKNALFLRRTGPWMWRAVERLVAEFAPYIVTARESAEQALTARDVMGYDAAPARTLASI